MTHMQKVKEELDEMSKEISNKEEFSGADPHRLKMIQVFLEMIRPQLEYEKKNAVAAGPSILDPVLMQEIQDEINSEDNEYQDWERKEYNDSLRLSIAVVRTMGLKNEKSMFFLKDLDSLLLSI